MLFRSLNAIRITIGLPSQNDVVLKQIEKNLMEGKYIPREETVRGFKEILEGEEKNPAEIPHKTGDAA